MLLRNTKIVPALMFHSVGMNRYPWVWSHISESVESFERKLAAFSRHGFSSVFWGSLYKYMYGGEELAKNSILLTFDDGYLDNWVFVYPLLKKYGMRGTIFVNPDFVDPGRDLRPNLEDVWYGRCRIEDLQVAGFLNWSEMREMERSGFIDIQSHAMSHTWYFSGPRILDFHRPGSIPRYPWLFWNAKPDRKPFYLCEDQQRFVPWGYPILEHEKALIARRFYPEESCVNRIVDYVADHGGEKYFSLPKSSEVLSGYVNTLLGGQDVPGKYETLEQQRDRIKGELSDSKNLIESHLKKTVEFICWPGGGNDDSVQELARDVGYKAWTLGSKDRSDKRNLPNVDAHTIKRIGTDNRIKIKGYGSAYGGAFYQLLRVLEHQGSFFYSVVLKLYKLGSFVGIVGRK